MYDIAHGAGHAMAHGMARVDAMRSPYIYYVYTYHMGWHLAASEADFELPFTLGIEIPIEVL